MKSLKTIYISIFMVLILGFFNGIAWATPSAEALYWEHDLGGGLWWKYDYILYNTSDPIADAGYDIYWFTLNFAPPVTLTNILSPSNWDLSSDFSSYIDWVSIPVGDPPIPIADIKPGDSLSGFSFTSNVQLTSLPFAVYLTDPSGEPIPYSGNTAPVPEPSIILLLGTGLAGLVGLVGLRKRLKIIG